LRSPNAGVTTLAPTPARFERIILRRTRQLELAKAKVSDARTAFWASGVLDLLDPGPAMQALIRTDGASSHAGRLRRYMLPCLSPASTRRGNFFGTVDQLICDAWTELDARSALSPGFAVAQHAAWASP